ncbi:hypothetical protein [Pseudomonas sp. DR48]|uniref:hypothetical protein n=1 Tax=Pseudomonas sp. DR48 TaxID=2871095 RepID=UPI0028F7214F|nr:hypothetical protein [Pseudomonas sp. DR48]
MFAPNETEGLRGLGKKLGPGPDYPGLLIGFWVAGHVSDYYATPAGHQWQSIWLFPAFFSLGVVLVFMFAFRDARRSELAPAKA